MASAVATKVAVTPIPLNGKLKEVQQSRPLLTYKTPMNLSTRTTTTTVKAVYNKPLIIQPPFLRYPKIIYLINIIIFSHLRQEYFEGALNYSHSSALIPDK